MINIEANMSIDWFFTMVSGITAVALLFFPKVVLLLMYRIAFGIFGLQGLEIPEHYREDYELLKNNHKDFFTKYKTQLFMLRLTGMVAVFLFLASICVPISFP